MVCQIVPAEAAAWFRACDQDNTREFWARERDAWARHVRDPLLRLLAAVGEDPTTWRVYRPHRDARFSPGAGPLKTFLGALREDDGGTGRYLQVDGRGLLASSGMPYLAGDQLPRWRAAVAGEDGEDLEEALAAARFDGLHVTSGYPPPLARTLRGTDPAHPRAELLRWKGIEEWSRLALDDPEGADGAGGPEGQARWLRATWAAGRPLSAWLAAHVGATAMVRSR